MLVDAPDIVVVAGKQEAAIGVLDPRQREPRIDRRGGGGFRPLFLDLGRAVFAAMGRPENITFIDTPIDIRDKYQYFTEARMEKLWSIGYRPSFTSLEDGVADYVKNYLAAGELHLQDRPF